MRKLIELESTDKSFSSYGGIFIAKTLLDELKLATQVSPYLPKTPKKNSPTDSKFQSLILGFIAGNDHLDDWEVSNKDAAIGACLQSTYGPKSLGDYLRSFSPLNLSELRHQMIDLSFSLREKLQPNTGRFILDLDSSLHEQYGRKMEGVEFCYKKFRALDSIMAFDELGLPYWHDVRPGSTYTSNGCGQIIHEIFSRKPAQNRKERRQQRRIVRADSGFFTSEFFNACRAKNAGFVCAAKKTDAVMNKVLRIKNWKTQNQDDPKRILATAGRECEIGHIAYHTKNYEGSLRLISFRAKKPLVPGIIYKDHNEYDYYCFVSNMAKDEFSDVEMIKLYRGRGNAENMIKEQKYGFDLKHFPCQKLTANKAFGLIASFAYGLTRFLALSSPRKKKTQDGIKSIVQFSKNIRNRCLLLPAQIIRHAGSVSFRFQHDHYREVIYWQKKLKNFQLGYS